jgi:hypothetical protein
MMLLTAALLHYTQQQQQQQLQEEMLVGTWQQQMPARVSAPWAADVARYYLQQKKDFAASCSGCGQDHRLSSCRQQQHLVQNARH